MQADHGRLKRRSEARDNDDTTMDGERWDA